MSLPALPSRDQALQSLKQAPLDVLVIGGGIVGAGIARDAAMRGLRVGLVEQHDFAFGTSGRSSRLLHGGLRYLAQGRVGLVREASVEKKIIHRIAPHLAQPLPFIFPTFKGNKDWVLWQLKLGVKIYDLLCGGGNFSKSSWLSREQVFERVAGLRREGLQGAVRYYDGLTNDARLTLDTLRSAERNGAVVLNYCRYADAARDRTWECALEDLCSGERFRVRTQAVVNAAGPWAEGLPHSRVKLRLTKGVHLVLQSRRLPVRETVVMTEGSRILFVIPWGERAILGTTDTDYEGPPEAVCAEPADIDYLLEVANRFFPESALGRSDIISTWAGLRPLVADPSGKPSDISRAHEITSPESSWWDVTGGKLTTYRLMAQETVDRVAAHLRRDGRLQGQPDRCRTAEEPLLPPAEVGGASALVPPEPSESVVAHCCAHEWTFHLDDLMIRRTGWHYYYAERAAIAEQAAHWMTKLLGWTEPVRRQELQRYLSLTGASSAPADETQPAGLTLPK